jgi:hypothetical protein
LEENEVEKWKEPKKGIDKSGEKVRKREGGEQCK